MEPEPAKSEQTQVEIAPLQAQEAFSAKRLGEGEHPLEGETAKEEQGISSPPGDLHESPDNSLITT